jgi:hypothetical protein
MLLFQQRLEYGEGPVLIFQELLVQLGRLSAKLLERGQIFLRSAQRLGQERLIHRWSASTNGG